METSTGRRSRVVPAGVARYSNSLQEASSAGSIVFVPKLGRVHTTSIIVTKMSGMELTATNSMSEFKSACRCNAAMCGMRISSCSTRSCMWPSRDASGAGFPSRFGNWHSIYVRMNRWAKNGVLDRVFDKLQQEQIVRIKIEAFSLDSTSVKVHPDGTGALKKTDRKPSESLAADGTPRFIWLPRMLERP